MIRQLATLMLVLSLATSVAFAEPAPAPVVPAISPTAPAVSPTLPPVATPSPMASAAGASPIPSPGVTGTALPAFLTYTGQLLDYHNNYVYFSTGDAFPADALLRIVDASNGLPTSMKPQAKMFAVATFDPATKKIIQLAITRQRLPTSKTMGPVSAFAIVASTPAPAPELAGQAVTGRQVAVVFEVTVPPTTSFTDNIYISTDTSDWNPTAIKLDRVDAYKYRALRYFASGTKFAYRVTRGTWNSVERGEDNLDAAPHQFFVREVDSLAARVTVYHWSDENPTAQGAGPNSIPTPYNPSPFGGGPHGISVPQIPTPIATRLP